MPSVNAQPGVEELVSTGVPGLDRILCGGFLRNNVYLLEGSPGSGKTTLALQFLLAGAARGERVIYVALSENRYELGQAAASHGWDLSKIDVFELNPIEDALRPDQQYTFFHPDEVELGATVNEILERARASEASLLVIDSLAELHLLARDTLRYRRQILALKQYFTGRDVTVLLLDDDTGLPRDRQLHCLVHGVITLERIPRGYGRNRRRLEVSKLRGVAYREGYHDLSIEYEGVSVYPRLTTLPAQPVKLSRGTVSSGVVGLDHLVGGGLDRGSGVLLMGPAGAGKTTLSLRYAAQALVRGEKVCFYLFDESANSLLIRANGLGLELDTYVASGQLLIFAVNPAQLSPGQFINMVCDGVERSGALMMVLDSLNGYLSAMPEEEFPVLQVRELLTYLERNGVVSLLVLAQEGGLLQAEAPVELSYLADTILLLRFFEAAGEVRRALSVVKRRTSGFEPTIREFRIQPPHGIEIGEPLKDFQGVLTGNPQYLGPHVDLKE